MQNQIIARDSCDIKHFGCPKIKVFNSTVCFQSHPAVIEAGKKALDTHGAGLSSVRFICGTMVSCIVFFHFDDIYMQYTVFFHGCKNDNFQMKIFDIFLIFAQSIDHGYTLQLSNKYPQSVF